MVIEKALKKIVSLNKSSKKKLASYGESIILTSRKRAGEGWQQEKFLCLTIFHNDAIGF